MPTNREEYFKRHKITKDSLSKSEISKISNIPIKILNDVYDRGIGAYSSNPQSVRTKEGKKDPKVPLSKKMSKEQWAMARVYSFVNKLEGRRKLNHDTDLAEKVSWYKK
jgi:hypothetical protein